MPNPQNRNIDRYLVLSGFLGSLIFLLVIAIAGSMYPGYDHVGLVISDLGAPESPVHLFMNIFGFGLFGFFMILFSVGLYRSTEFTAVGKASSIFFFLTGVLMIIVGISPTYVDWGIYSVDDLHQLCVIFQFPVMTVGVLLIAADSLRNKKLHWLTPYIITQGLATLAFGNLYLFVWPQPFPPGITQRITLTLAFSMMAVISLKLYNVQYKTSIKRLLLLALVIVIVSAAITYPQQSSIESSREGLPTLRGLCYGIDGCNEFCQNRYGTCSAICGEEPENPLCDRIDVLKTGG